MKPYFTIDDITLFAGDCAEIIPQLAPASVDLVVTSPPFNADMVYEKGAWPTLAAYRTWLCAQFVSLYPLCASGAWVTCELQDLHVSPEHSHALPGQKEQFNMATCAHLTVAMEAAGFYYKGEVIWHRGRFMNNMAGRMACAPGSPAILGQHSKVLFFRKPGGRKGVYQYPEMLPAWKAKWCRSVWEDIPLARHAKHPAVMPEVMAAALIDGWSVPGHLVLDPFAGIGTTLLAARKLGRRAIGIEKDADYLAIAAEALRQLPLFAAADAASAQTSPPVVRTPKFSTEPLF